MSISRFILPCRLSLNLVGPLALQKIHGRVLSAAVVKGEIYEKNPAKVEVKAGKVYSWCACGRSKNQPFCDGSHKYDKDTGEKLSEPPIKSVKYKANEDRTVFFCNCKQSGKLPLCDGTHKNL